MALTASLRGRFPKHPAFRERTQPASVSQIDPTASLERLGALFTGGLLTKAEFRAAKQSHGARGAPAGTVVRRVMAVAAEAVPAVVLAAEADLAVVGHVVHPNDNGGEEDEDDDRWQPAARPAKRKRGQAMPAKRKQPAQPAARSRFVGVYWIKQNRNASGEHRSATLVGRKTWASSPTKRRQPGCTTRGHGGCVEPRRTADGAAHAPGG